MKYWKRFLNKVFKRANFIPVPLQKGSSGMQVMLRYEDQQVNVTHCHTLVALKPVVISVTFPYEMKTERIKLDILKGGEKKGELSLRFQSTLQEGINFIHLYEVIDYHNCNFTFFKKIWNDFFLLMQGYGNLVPYNFKMSVDELNSLHVYYMIPKPVVLITVYEGNRYDIFPMDILGRASEDVFLLGLRNTSPALQKIIQSSQLCISGVPFEKKEQAYMLGIHHKNAEVDLKKLPFKTIDSQKLKYQVPDFSLDVMEVSLQQHRQVGSHTLLVTKINNYYVLNKGAQLTHVSWFFRTHFAD